MRYLSIGKQCVVFLSIFIINGCTCIFRLAPEPPPMIKGGQYSLAQFELDTNSYNTTNDLAYRTRLRDKMVYGVASEIDKNYSKFRNKLFGGVAAAQTSFEIATLGLTSAATLAGGETAKAILAAISTGLAGSALSFGKNVFKEKSSDLIISRMDSLRQDKWANIFRQLNLLKDDKYSWYQAERDLVEYFWAGSIPAAIQSIFVESGATQAKANATIRDAIDQKLGLTPLPPPGHEDPELYALLTELLKMKEPDKTTQAQNIIKEFSKLMPEINIPNYPPIDKVRWLHFQAPTNTKLRDNLIKAYGTVRKNTFHFYYGGG